ncbi:MAG: hypothetical protein AAF195_03705 [Pseudomonadota bacterium]
MSYDSDDGYDGGYDSDDTSTDFSGHGTDTIEDIDPEYVLYDKHDSISPRATNSSMKKKTTTNPYWFGKGLYDLGDGLDKMTYNLDKMTGELGVFADNMKRFNDLMEGGRKTSPGGGSNSELSKLGDNIGVLAGNMKRFNDWAEEIKKSPGGARNVFYELLDDALYPVDGFNELDDKRNIKPHQNYVSSTQTSNSTPTYPLTQTIDKPSLIRRPSHTPSSSILSINSFEDLCRVPWFKDLAHLDETLSKKNDAVAKSQYTISPYHLVKIFVLYAALDERSKGQFVSNLNELRHQHLPDAHSRNFTKANFDQVVKNIDLAAIEKTIPVGSKYGFNLKFDSDHNLNCFLNALGKSSPQIYDYCKKYAEVDYSSDKALSMASILSAEIEWLEKFRKYQRNGLYEIPKNVISGLAGNPNLNKLIGDYRDVIDRDGLLNAKPLTIQTPDATINLSPARGDDKFNLFINPKAFCKIDEKIQIDNLGSYSAFKGLFFGGSPALNASAAELLNETKIEFNEKGAKAEQVNTYMTRACVEPHYGVRCDITINSFKAIFPDIAVQFRSDSKDGATSSIYENINTVEENPSIYLKLRGKNPEQEPLDLKLNTDVAPAKEVVLSRCNIPPEKSCFIR